MLKGLVFHAFLASLTYIVSCFWILSRADLPDILPLIVAGITALLCVAGCVFTRKFSRFVSLLFVLACALLFCAWQTYQARNLLELRLPAALDNQIIQVEGRVIGLPESRDRVQVFDFEVMRSEKAWSELTTPRKLRLSIYEPLASGAIRGGESYRLTVKLKQPRGAVNFSGFDYERWLFTQGYHGRGYVRSTPENQKLPEDGLSLSRLREHWREKLIQPPVSQERALILALVLGDQSLIHPTTQTLLIHTGIAHLLAISGMHISLLALASFAVLFVCFRAMIFAINLVQLRFTDVRWRLSSLAAMRLALIGAFIFALLYSLISGFALPSQRAVIMLFCYSFAMLYFSRVNYFLVWYVSLVVVLIFQPYAVNSASLYLSFAAVLLIQWFLMDYTKRDFGTWIYKLKLFTSMQAMLTICLAPLSLSFFSAWFFEGFLANFIAVPLVNLFVLPASLIACVFQVLDMHSVSAPLLIFSEYLLSHLLTGLTWLDMGIPFNAGFYLDAKSSTLLFLFFLLVISPLPHSYKVLSWVLVLAALAHFFQKNTLQEGEFRLRMLDVGQGLSLVIETQNHRLLYDAGPALGDYFDAGKMIVVPALKEAARNFSEAAALDLMVLSHSDMDHIGGANSISKHMNVHKVLAFPQAFDKASSEWRDEVVGYEDCVAGQQWQWDAVHFEVLAPFADENRALMSTNNQSCVIKVSGKQASVLLTGDIEAGREAFLTQKYGEYLKSDVLVAAHHGSKTSSNLLFLQAVAPEMILVSAGWKHHFGHPHLTVTQRFEALEIPWHNTANQGEVVVDSRTFAQPRFARTELRRFWR